MIILRPILILSRGYHNYRLHSHPTSSFGTPRVVWVLSTCHFASAIPQQSMVYAHDALENRANEEGRPETACSPPACGKAGALLPDWFRAKGRLSSGIVENFNTKAKLTSRKSFGFRTYHAMEIALHHALGTPPELEGTHRFC